MANAIENTTRELVALPRGSVEGKDTFSRQTITSLDVTRCHVASVNCYIPVSSLSNAFLETDEV